MRARRYAILASVGAAFALALGGCALTASPDGGGRPSEPPSASFPAIPPLPSLRIPGSDRFAAVPADPLRYPAASDGRAFVKRLLPRTAGDPSGWATDIFAAFATMDIVPSIENVCAAIAIIEQESGFQVDPAIPGLPRIAWKEIENRRAKLGIPRWALEAALALPSSNGRSFKSRIDKVRTERELNAIFDDFIGMVPLGRTFLAARNPVRTGGPMQVSVEFAEAQVGSRPYPYPVARTLRDEVFTRHGGVYFGVAHLLDYSAPYDAMIYRFADFNAGRYASRNAAFQRALTELSGLNLVADGDLLRYTSDKTQGERGATALAAETMGRRLRLGPGAIEHDLKLAKTAAFEQSLLSLRVFELAQARSGRSLPRAVLPQIDLKSPKIKRKLTTEWFARRVEERYRSCLARAPVLRDAP